MAIRRLNGVQVTGDRGAMNKIGPVTAIDQKCYGPLVPANIRHLFGHQLRYRYWWSTWEAWLDSTLLQRLF
jgi:hypothetical protein